MHHTRLADAADDQLAMGRVLEGAALELLQNRGERESESGVRVMPKQRRFCLFSGLNKEGYPNPLSFHGGEAMDEGGTKEVLSFFYEVPLGTFGNREQFGERVREREERFLDLHCS